MQNFRPSANLTSLSDAIELQRESWPDLHEVATDVQQAQVQIGDVQKDRLSAGDHHILPALQTRYSPTGPGAGTAPPLPICESRKPGIKMLGRGRPETAAREGVGNFLGDHILPLLRVKYFVSRAMLEMLHRCQIAKFKTEGSGAGLKTRTGNGKG
jgi:hypothetical protein